MDRLALSGLVALIVLAFLGLLVWVVMDLVATVVSPLTAVTL